MVTAYETLAVMVKEAALNPYTPTRNTHGEEEVGVHRVLSTTSSDPLLEPVATLLVVVGVEQAALELPPHTFTYTSGSPLIAATVTFTSALLAAETVKL